MDGYIVFVNLVMLGVLSFFIGYPICIINRNRKQKKEQKELKQRQEEQQKRHEELEKIRQAEQEKKDKEAKLFIDVYNIVEKNLSSFFKNKSSLHWIMDNEVVPILNDLPKKRLEVIRQEFLEHHKITNIGPFVLNKEQILIWYKRYLNEKTRLDFEKQRAIEEEHKRLSVKRKAEAEKERIANRMKAEKDKKWLCYVDRFRKYNKAQQKSELEWFKNKLVSTFTNDQDEKELYIHELEMVMLEDEKRG